MIRVLLLALALTLGVPAQETDDTKDVREEYTKYEFEIPMRDGLKLFTAVYVPKDSSRTYPIMLERTPYGVDPYGTDRYPSHLGPSDDFQHSGYIFAYQDVRGRYMSDGTWEEMRPFKPQKSGAKDFDESTDTWDTIDWLVKNIPGNDGKVGMWGVSYPGF
jgi:putative CocE/NonD family hydrolase